MLLVTCPNPDNITDGSYRGIDYTDGGTVTYVCDNQYFLDGSSNITCVDGRWNSPPPVCRGMSQIGCFVKTKEKVDIFQRNSRSSWKRVSISFRSLSLTNITKSGHH